MKVKKIPLRNSKQASYKYVKFIVYYNISKILYFEAYTTSSITTDIRYNNKNSYELVSFF